MPILNKTDLFHVLFDAFHQHTNSIYFEGGDNPYRFCLEDKFVTVFIGNIHPARRRDVDEYRIQCSGNLPKTLHNKKMSGDTVFVLGFSEDVHAFSAWDPDKFLVRNPGTRRFSLYTRLSGMKESISRGLSTYTDTNGQNVIMFRPDLLGLYVENSTALHQARDQTLRRIAEFYGHIQSGQQTPVPSIKVNRRKIRLTRTQYSRSPKFRQEVLGAYGHKCAMCEIQLDLVDAAHIVPHAHPKGSDTVGNGLALCVLHHRSFDTGLLYVQYVKNQGDYLIHMNPARVLHLQKMGKADGLQSYKKQLRSKLFLPDNYDLFPAPDNLTLGNTARGIFLEG